MIERWLGVAAFALVVVELVAAGVGVVVVRRAWAKVEPQVRPLLAMFGAPTTTTGATTATTPPVEPDERLPLPPA